MKSDDHRPSCPICKGKRISVESKEEYTGGGFADSWDECICKKCGHIWRVDEKSGYI